MTGWIDEVFEGASVPPWLRQFEREPVEALSELLLGIAPLGHLAAAEPDLLLVDWIEMLAPKSEGAVRRVDEALAAWIDRSWGDPLLGATFGSAARTAAAWCRACDVIAMMPALSVAAEALRVRVLDDRGFLDALAEGPPRDPLGRAWLALARHQRDRGLVDWWWQLCRLPPNEPWHRGWYGIEGLRGLPPAPDAEHEAGGFSGEVARGLVELGLGLERRREERWLRPEMARDEFLRIGRLTMAAYPMPDVWAAFWSDALKRRDVEGNEVEEWIGKLSARLENRPGGRRKAVPTRDVREPQWRDRVQEIARRLANGRDLELTIEDAQAILRLQNAYAERSGNYEFLSLSACNFAARVREHKPAQALEWARLGKKSNPWNDYAWKEEASILLTMGRADGALRSAIEAVNRFPDDPASYNVLAQVLRAQSRVEQAEAQYRLTIARFPDNVVARSGLAEVLRDQERFDEAEAQYRLTIARFPEDVVAHAALAEVLRAQGRLDEAEAQYQLTIERFPHNEVAQTGLQNVRKPLKTTDTVAAEAPKAASQSRSEPQLGSGDALSSAGESATTSPDLQPDDVETLLTDASLLRRWARQTGLASSLSPGALRERARNLLHHLAIAEARSARAAGELGLLELAEGDIETAVKLLREAARRFPGSARVRYALGRATRQLAEHERRRLDPKQPDALAQPWRKLAQINSIHKPVQLLGEGRSWLAQVDGATVDEGARNAFGQLGHWVRDHLKSSAPDLPESASPEDLRPRFQLVGEAPFSAWWAREVQIHLFGGHEIRRAEDLPSLDPIRERLAVHSRALDEIEESWVNRHAPT